MRRVEDSARRFLPARCLSAPCKREIRTVKNALSHTAWPVGQSASFASRTPRAFSADCVPCRWWKCGDMRSAFLSESGKRSKTERKRPGRTERLQIEFQNRLRRNDGTFAARRSFFSYAAFCAGSKPRAISSALANCGSERSPSGKSVLASSSGIMISTSGVSPTLCTAAPEGRKYCA